MGVLVLSTHRFLPDMETDANAGLVRSASEASGQETYVEAEE